MKKSGFTLIELLIVIAIIGILAAVLVPSLTNARRVAVDRAAQSYAQNIYKATWAYLAESPGAGALTSSCGSGNYAIGSYTVFDPNLAVTSCSVSYPTSDGGVSISLAYTGGTRATYSLGQ